MERDRRLRRSAYASEALRLQLERVAATHELDGLVLADRLGHLWASSQPVGGTALARWARLGPRADEQPQRHPGPVALRWLQVSGADLCLVASGGGAERRALGVAAGGVQRILEDLACASPTAGGAR